MSRPTQEEEATVTERYRRLDDTRPHRKIQITETGFSVSGRDILESETAKQTLRRVKENLVVERSSQESEPAPAG